MNRTHQSRAKNGKHIPLIIGLFTALVFVLCGLYLAYLAFAAQPSSLGANRGYWRVAIFREALSAFGGALVNEVVQWD